MTRGDLGGRSSCCHSFGPGDGHPCVESSQLQSSPSGECGSRRHGRNTLWDPKTRR